MASADADRFAAVQEGNPGRNDLKKSQFRGESYLVKLSTYPLSRPTHSIVEEFEGFQKFKTFAAIRVARLSDFSSQCVLTAFVLASN